MVQSIQLPQEVTDLLRKGAIELARKDAEFLQKRINALQNEMSIMTSLLGSATPDTQGPILKGLQQLGDRLKSAGKAVAGFSNGYSAANGKSLLSQYIDTAQIASLRATLTQNYLGLADSYNTLGGGSGIATRDTNALTQKSVNRLV